MSGPRGAAGDGAADPSAGARGSGEGDRVEPDASGVAPRQRVERVRGRRRAKLTPAPGSDPSPESPVHRDAPSPGPSAPDDERITRERPPHW
ncbi:hypothetical protein ACWKWP_05480 [Agromyces soli]